MTHHLFSEELFSDTRLSQANQFAQFAKSIKMNMIMQNKPNFQNTQMNTTPYTERLYKKFARQSLVAGKPKQTQFKPNSNPIQTHFSYQNPPPKPKQTHFYPQKHPPKPKQTQILPAELCGGQTQFPRWSSCPKIRLRNYEIPKGKKI